MRPDFDRILTKVPRFTRQGAEEAKSTAPAVENIQIPEKQVIYIDRTHHPLDELTLPSTTKELIGESNSIRLDLLREAFASLNRDLLMVIGDNDLTNFDPDGELTHLNIDIYTAARNKPALAKDKADLLESLKKHFGGDVSGKKQELTKRVVTRQNDTIIIEPKNAKELPIKINLRNTPGIDLENTINSIREEKGNNFAGYSIRKLTPNELNPEQRARFLKRDTSDFYDNLYQADLDQVRKVLSAIQYTIPDVTLSEIVVVAEGSTTTPKAQYKDIDLRIIYAAHPGNNIDSNPKDIADELETALKNNKIPYSKKRETKYRQLSTEGIKEATSLKDLPTVEVETKEPSFEVYVPETGKFIQIIINGEPTKSLKLLYSGKDRTDLPVILDRFNIPGGNFPAIS